MDDFRLIKPLPDFVIPGLCTLSLVTGLFGVIATFDGLNAMGRERSRFVAQQSMIDQELLAHSNRRQVLDSYEAHGLHEIKKKLHMKDYWCSSGEPPYSPVTPAMKITETTYVHDMTGSLVGRILTNGNFQEIEGTCWREYTVSRTSAG